MKNKCFTDLFNVISNSLRILFFNIRKYNGIIRFRNKKL